MSKHLIIIGNGFDLSLGLSTSYTDFIKSTEFNQLITNKNALAIYLQSKHNLQNWIDIEAELKTYPTKFKTDCQEQIRKLTADLSNSYLYKSGGLLETPEASIRNIENKLKMGEENLKNAATTVRQEYNALCNALMNYLGTLKLNFEKCQNTWAFKLIKNVMDDTAPIYNNIQVINFNYTDSVQQIVNFLKSPTRKRSAIQETKIHGSLKDKNIIFGVEDKAVEDDYLFLQKSYNLNFGVASIANKIKNEGFRQISIFGHSLGESDTFHFQFLASLMEDSQPYKNFVFYYYKDHHNLSVQLNKLTNGNLADFKTYNEVKYIDTSNSIQ